MHDLNLIMPMGGSGVRFAVNGFGYPKPLIPLNGKPFFYWATQSIIKFIPVKSLTFVVLKDHIIRFGIDREILRYYPQAHIHVLDHVLNGAVLTCLAGIVNVQEDEPVLFNDCDHCFLCCDFYRYINNGGTPALDGALLTFPSNDPKFSFVRLDQKGNVEETVEKRAVSDQAVCGAYYFRNKLIFQAAAEIYLKECVYKEYFVSGIYNVLVRGNAVVRTFQVDMHLPFGTPEEYEIARNYSEFGVFD